MITKNELLPFLKEYFTKHGIPINEFMIFGIRYEENQDKDIYNDLLGFIYNDTVYLMEGTTDPGIYWTKNPMNVKGTAHLCLGYHPDIWMLGIHGGTRSYAHEAFVQVGKCKVWRDFNRNAKFDKNEIIDEGLFGINFHTDTVISDLIGRWSAGCQVVKDANDLKEMIAIFKKTAMYKKNKKCRVSYYLFDKSEIIYG